MICEDKEHASFSSRIDLRSAFCCVASQKEMGYVSGIH